jgi:hypothetical protein
VQVMAAAIPPIERHVTNQNGQRIRKDPRQSEGQPTEPNVIHCDLAHALVFG